MHTHTHTRAPNTRTFHPLAHVTLGQRCLLAFGQCSSLSLCPSLSPLCHMPRYPLYSPSFTAPQLLGPLLLLSLFPYTPHVSLLPLCYFPFFSLPHLFSASSPWDVLLQVLGPQEAASPPESSTDLEARTKLSWREVSLSPDTNILPWARAS